MPSDPMSINPKSDGSGVVIADRLVMSPSSRCPLLVVSSTFGPDQSLRAGNSSGSPSESSTGEEPWKLMENSGDGPTTCEASIPLTTRLEVNIQLIWSGSEPDWPYWT